MEGNIVVIINRGQFTVYEKFVSDVLDTEGYSQRILQTYPYTRLIQKVSTFSL